MSTAELRRPAPRLDLGQRLALGAEIFRAYLAVWRLRRRRGLPAVIDGLRAVPIRTGLPLPDPPLDGIRLGRAVIRTLTIAPGGRRCLTRSLVLLRLLARRGVVEGELIVAVQPGSTTLDAHAWIELDGRPLLPPGSGYERLLTL